MYYNNYNNRYPGNNKKRGYGVRFARQLGIVLILFLCFILVKFVNNEATKGINGKLKEIFYSDYTEEATEVFKNNLGDSINIFKNNNEDFYIGELPVKGERLKGYGEKFINPLTQREEIHNGIEIEVADGEEIRAVSKGTVESVKVDEEGSNTILINHGDGFKTIHIFTGVVNIKDKESVIKGQVIGKCQKNSGGKSSTFYFELQKNGNSVNPEDYIEAISK